MKKKNNTTIVKSDHHLIIGSFNQSWNCKISEAQSCVEILNFKDQNGWKRYKLLTSENTLTNCFKGVNFEEESRIWFKKFNNILHRSFPKVRIAEKNKFDCTQKLMTEKSELQCEIIKILELEIPIQEKADLVSSLEKKIDFLDRSIANLCAEKNANLIRTHYSNLSDFGNFSNKKMWSLNRKLKCRSTDPTAKYDEKGNLVCDKKGLLFLYQNEYFNRLQQKPPKNGLLQLQYLKEYLFNIRFEISKNIKSNTWT